MRLSVGDVWRAWVPYNDAKGDGKLRPVVVLGWSPNTLVDDTVVLLVPITSFDGTDKSRYGDVPIQDLSRAGLTKPSWIRARRLFNVTPNSLDRQRGQLGTVTSDEIGAIYTEIERLIRPSS